MSTPALTAAFTALAGCAVILPQILRILRVDSAAGVAVAGVAGSVWGYTGWLIYTSRSSGGWSYLALAVPAALQVINLLLVGIKGGHRRGLAPIIIFGASVSVIVTVGPLDKAVWVLLLMGAAAYIPTVRSAWHAPNIHGVSRLAWTLSAVHSFGWSAHGAAIGDVFVVANGTVNVVSSTLVLIATFMRHDVWEHPLDASPGLR